jgi:hypothetical protein
MGIISYKGIATELIKPTFPFKSHTEITSKSVYV